MPRPRDVKPWTVYPPTQEDREIIERKAGEASLSVSAYLCMVGKLACLQVNIGTAHEVQPVLSASVVEPELEQVSTPKQTKPYTLYNLNGVPLSEADADYVHRERAAGRTEPYILSEDEDPYRTRKIFRCEGNGLKFEVVPTQKEA